MTAEATARPTTADGSSPKVGSAETMPAFMLLADRIGVDKALLVATKLMVCDPDDFHKFDADRSGMISKWEFTAMFRQAMFVRKRELTDNDVDFVWNTMDSDRSGTISLAEFIEFAHGGKSKGGADEKVAAMKGAALTLEAAALHKSGKLEDCIPKYLDSLNFTSNRRARFVTLNNLGNAYVQRAVKDPEDRVALRANALAMWREALKIVEGEFDRATVAYNAGNLLLEDNELKEAIKMFKLVLDVGADTAYAAKAHTQLGIALREAGYQRRMSQNRM